MIFFSAHGVPVSYVRDAGDPYKDQMEECIDLIMHELKARGIHNHHKLAYQVPHPHPFLFQRGFKYNGLIIISLPFVFQSRVGPVEWLKPYTDEVLVELGQKGVKSLLAVPVRYLLNSILYYYYYYSFIHLFLFSYLIQHLMT